MADTTKKTTRSKKVSTKTAAGVPTAKAVAAAAVVAESKGQPAPAAVKTAVTPASAKPAPVTVKADQKTITKEERARMIEQAAYFRAEKHGFQGDASQHWNSAEAEIDADLKRRNIRVS